MKLIADFHTHSKNSRFFHGKNNLEEMVISANEMGLEEIAVTDHGFKHLFRTNKAKIIKAREIVDEINKWSKTKVLLGVEADIIAEDGTIDIDNDTLSYLDILLVGYHKMIKTDFAGYFGGQAKSPEAIQKCTNAFINAINRYPITILTHLDSILTTDLYQIGKACKEKGVLVEINNRHTKWSSKQVEDLLASGCMFVVSSDAHCREDVGKVDRAFEIVKKYNIPSELVANVEFSEDEMSEDDKKLEAYFSIYKQKQKEREEKLKQWEDKKKTEFTETLSPEMEAALAKIAKEKGLYYKEKDVEFDDGIDDVDFNIFNDDEQNDSDELIRKANEIIKNNSFGEFDTQNEKLNGLSEVIAKNVESENVLEANMESEESAVFDETIKTDTENSAEAKSENQTSDKLLENNETISSNRETQSRANVKNGFSLNIRELENDEPSVASKPATSAQTAVKKPAKNDVAGLVQFALGNNKTENNESEKKIAKPAAKSEIQARQNKSRFNPLGVLNDDSQNKDNKK